MPNDKHILVKKWEDDLYENMIYHMKKKRTRELINKGKFKIMKTKWDRNRGEKGQKSDNYLKHQII